MSHFWTVINSANLAGTIIPLPLLPLTYWDKSWRDFTRQQFRYIANDHLKNNLSTIIKPNKFFISNTGVQAYVLIMFPSFSLLEYTGSFDFYISFNVYVLLLYFPSSVIYLRNTQVFVFVLFCSSDLLHSLAYNGF